MNKNMLKKGLESLTPEKGIKLAFNYGVNLDKNEATIILSFLKRHIDELDMSHIPYLLNEIQNEVSLTTYQKIELLLNKLLLL